MPTDLPMTGMSTTQARETSAAGRARGLARALVCAAALAVMLAWSAGASAAGGSLDGREQYVLGRINAIRAEHGLPAKQASMTLNRAAEGFAQYLQDHGDPNDEGHFADGRTPSLRDRKSVV